MKLAPLLLLVVSLSNWALALQHDTCIIHVNKDGAIMESLTARHILTGKNFKLASIDSTENLRPGQLYTQIRMNTGNIKKREHDRPFKGCAVSFKIIQVIKEEPFLTIVYDDGKVKKNTFGSDKSEAYNLSCDKALKKVFNAVPECQIIH